MVKLKVEHYREDCIACGACAAIAPEQWFMDEDTLSTCKGAVKVGGHFEKEISEDEKEAHKEAQDVCPVQIIKVVEEE